MSKMVIPDNDGDRLRWWREARFGLFIHWGVYSVLEGYWQGKQTEPIGEWIQHSERIPMAEYRKFAKQLTLERFDATEWVALAKAAGMKYIVLTAKHADGFAMYDSKCSDYNIVKMGPSGRDPARELAEAARKAGLTMCFYYSQAVDFEHPDAPGNDWDFDPAKADFSRYFEEKCKPQLRELLTEYGDVGMIWFDNPRVITWEQSLELKQMMAELQPACLSSGRLSFERGMSDYDSLGDNQIMSWNMSGDWETPATMNDTWGYKRGDQNWKSSAQMIQQLVDLSSKGVNYLLNIGPKADGEIPEPSVRSLKDFSKWMGANAESIHGSSASPFTTAFDWGRITTKENKLYCHVFDQSKRLELPGLRNHVTAAEPLASLGHGLKIEQSHDAKLDRHMVAITLPEKAADEPLMVVKLELDGVPDIIVNPFQSPDGSLFLTAAKASCQGQDASSVASGRYNLNYPEKQNVTPAEILGEWLAGGLDVSWDFLFYEPGEFLVEMRVATKSPQDMVEGFKIRLECDGQEMSATLADGKMSADADSQGFMETTLILGRLPLSRPGRRQLLMRAEGPWKPMINGLYLRI